MFLWGFNFCGCIFTTQEELNHLFVNSGSTNTSNSPANTVATGSNRSFSSPSINNHSVSNPLVRSPSVSNPPIQYNNTSSNSLSEHRRVFNYAASTRFATSTSTQRGRHQKGKKKVTTCTLKFFCLGNKDDEKPPPTIAGKAALSYCGLGPASITCDVNAESIHENLCEQYPPLATAGGYELLIFQRGGEERGFCKLPTPYSPARLRDVAGQANIYIRPLQKNIKLENQERTVQPAEVSFV